VGLLSGARPTGVADKLHENRHGFPFRINIVLEMNEISSIIK
jgi:hypothetical protein